MNNFDSLVMCLYEFLDFEDVRLLDRVELQRNVFKYNPCDPYSLIKLYEAITLHNEFIVVKKRIFEILRYYNELR